MTLLDAVDLYCERTHAGVLAEPINVLSNLFFFLAAWWLLRRQFPSEARLAVRLMAMLLVLVGVCSTLFHLFGEVWAGWVDSGAIALFVLIYLQRYITQVMRRGNASFALAVIGLFLAERVIGALGEVHLNGSEIYLPPWVALILLARWAERKSPASAPWMLGAAMLFPISLALRTVDLMLCARLPWGTHFAWHALNALVLYCCVRGLAAGCHERSGRFQGLLTATTVLERER